MSSKRLRMVLCVTGVLILTRPVHGAEVSTFGLGRSSQPGLYYHPAFMHGVNAFESIRITFNADVFVDFYDLRLQVVGAESNRVPITGFTYDSGSRAAVWTIDEQGLQQNARYLATLTGVFDAGGAPLSGGVYTNAFTILTCDVSGDDQVTSVDALVVVNHINLGLPYDPVLDVDWNGAVNSIDELLIVNFLNTYGNVSLAAPGDYRSVPMIPTPDLAIAEIHEEDGRVMLEFSGLPTGCLASITGKVLPSDADWYAVLDFFATNGIGAVSFPMLPSLTTEFYRASFR